MVRQISTEEIRQSIQAVAQAHPEIHLICLFGSRARNQAHRLSDYDIAVLVDPLPEEAGHYKIDLICELMANLRTDAVDVVLINQATPLLKMLIYRDALVLYQASSDVWPRFAVQALREYEDTKKLRAIQNEYLVQHLRAERVRK